MMLRRPASCVSHHAAFLSWPTLSWPGFTHFARAPAEQFGEVGASQRRQVGVLPQRRKVRKAGLKARLRARESLPMEAPNAEQAAEPALSIRHTQLAALCCANGTGNVHIHKSCCDKKVTPPLRSTAWPHLQARQRAFPLRHGRVGARHVVQRALLFRIRRAPALQSSCSINSRKDKGRALALPRPPRERAREEALQDHARLRSTAPKLQHVRSGNTPAAHGCWAT